jgi:tRNA threonylcarbamoyladenosine biosynthesis protein TsaE
LKEIRVWKKVFENDIPGIIHEMRDHLEVPIALVLTGELGSGKTTFVRFFCQAMNGGASAHAPSPTYSLVQEIGKVVHSDLFRLEDSRDITMLELPLYLEDRQYFLAEWGKGHLSALKRQLPEEFKLFELVIEINQPTKEGALSSRNYVLQSLE